MLKLRRLELSGFKSFVDPVGMDFGGGMTSIVGPNGCGKSNLADAVVWVLGERSAKALRGRKMDDVIFNGSSRRKPLGLCEVSLELSTESSLEHAENGSLTLGRRLFRDGESHYLMNGRRVRLKEIRDLLMGTGLGIRAYSVIEQGRIGQILSGKPLERRKLLEEAAGVTRYRERRRLAEIKLEEARANLERLDDIVAEVERSVRSLKRQAGAARRYKRRQDEYRRLLRAVLEGRWGRLGGRLAELRGRLAAEVAREAEVTAALHRDEAALAAGREDLDALARRLAERHQREAELAARIEGKQEFLKGSRERLRELAERVAAGRGTAAERRRRIEALAGTLEGLEARRRELAGERDRAASEVSEDDQRISQVERLVAEAEERMEGLRGRLFTSLADLNGLRNRLHREQLEREKGDLRRKHLLEERERKEREVGEAEEAAAAAEEKVRTLEEKTAGYETRLGEHQTALDELLARHAEGAAARDALAAELAALGRRREVLAELGRTHRERREALVEALAAAGLGEPEFLADRLDVPAGWERSLDLYLGELADAVIVPPSSEGLELAGALAAGRGSGRLLEPADPFAAAPAPPALDDPAVRTSLGEALGLPPALAAALPPAFLVESSADAARLARRHPGIAFLSRDRLWAAGGVIAVAGEQAPPGALAREHELAATEAGIPPLESRRGEAEEALERLAAEVGRERAAIGELDRELAAERQELAVARARHDDLAARLRRLTVERETVATEGAEVERELGLASERATRLAAELERSQGLHAELEAVFDRAQAEAARSREGREAARTTGASRKGRLELLEERLDSHRQETERVRGEIEEGERQIGLWAEEEERLGRRETEIREAMRAAESELEEALAARDASQGEVVAEQERLDARRAEVRAIEARLEGRREERDGVREGIGELRVEEAGLKQEAGHLEATFAEEFGRELGAPLPAEPGPETGAESAAGVAAGPEAPPPSAGAEEAGGEEAAPAGPAEPAEPSRPLEELEEELAACRAALERLGPVNLLAAEEYDEQEQRRAFLTEQREDVRSSVESLRQTIREINRTSTERFRSTFEQVNAHFRGTFVELFRGGEAEMRLMDEDDLLECGIEIVARPPGKRLQNLMLLSGGEKALTAIALLFALFQTKPSPFCILDEVDAPLDDVNTLRFLELLKKMSRETQFIVITHNKLTMEASSTLYGVTMQEKGVSGLVSVELDQLQPEPALATA